MSILILNRRAVQRSISLHIPSLLIIEKASKSVSRNPVTPSSSLYDIPVNAITGEDLTLAAYRGKVLLIVNVASQCGLTKQYEALETLYTRFKDAGLVVLGFPANDFGAQEPGSSQEIQAFCTNTYGVDFPMFQKISVTGPATHPLYQSLIEGQPKAIGDTRPAFRERLNGFLRDVHNGATTNPEPGILWNFEKFLVDRNGTVIARFSPEVAPNDPGVIAAIESALAS
jgi:glutathione peroxidase